MKKKLITPICLVLTLIMMLAFSGCGENEKSGDDKSAQKKSDAETFIGTWNVKLDLSDAINKEMSGGEGEQMKEYFDFDGLAIDVAVNYDKDGTYKISADENALDKVYDNVVVQLTAGMKKYLEAIAEGSGQAMSADEMLEASGMSMDDLIEQSFPKEQFTSMADDLEKSGKYKVEDGKLYSSDGEDKEIDTDEYETYEIVSDSEIKITGYVGEEENDAEMYPFIMKK